MFLQLNHKKLEAYKYAREQLTVLDKLVNKTFALLTGLIGY
jgi:hypothetical protein